MNQRWSSGRRRPESPTRYLSSMKTLIRIAAVDMLPIAADGAVSLPAVTSWAVVVVEKRDAGTRPGE